MADTAIDLDELERTLSKVVDANPGAHEAWHARAMIALQAAAPQRACELAKRAHQLDRKNAEYLNTLGIALAECGLLDESEAALKRSLKLKPASAQTHHNYGKLLFKQHRLDAAAVAYGRALAIDASYPGVRYNLANTFMRMGEPERALPLLRAIVAADPLEEDAWIALAEACFSTRGADAAKAEFESVLRRAPELARVREYYGKLLLGLGRFEEGWREYAWRAAVPRSDADRSAVFALALPVDLAGRAILLRQEQGLGDVLFFLRFAKLLGDRGARLVLECPPKLAGLLRDQSFLSDIVETGKPPARDFAYTFSLGDLPLVLGGSAIAPPLRITAREQHVHAARERLAGLGPAPYIGLTWRAGTDVVRSAEFGSELRVLFKQIDIESLGALLRALPGTLLALQRLPCPGEIDRLGALARRTVHDLSSLNDDLEAMAGLLSVLDDYVGVSNTNVHLMQCVGKTARVLIPYPPEFRWMRASGESPWFPGFATYRQDARQRWDAALEQLRADAAS
jgi:Tfp pilus assembly protein PilF